MPRLKSSLPFRSNPSLQAERQLLLESAVLPIECWLERLSSEMELERFSDEKWEELFLIQGELDCNQNAYKDVYLCLPPGQSMPPLCAGSSGAVVLRLIFGNEQEQSKQSPVTVIQGKPPVETLNFKCLAWNEIPARRPNDAGARIAELATNAPRTRITSLMDCRPNWILADHDHSSDTLTFCVAGGGMLGIEEQSTAYDAGHLVAIPAGVRHCFEAGDEGALLVVFVFEPFLR